MALIGASFAGPLSSWFSGNQVVYAQINQSRQDQGITVTLLGGYVSDGGTELEVKIQKDTGHGVPFASITILKYQQKVLTMAGGVGTGDLRTNFTCLVSWASAVHPPADVQTITLTWHVTKLYVQTAIKIPPQVIQGDWTFQFTLPFHHDNSIPSRSISTRNC